MLIWKKRLDGLGVLHCSVRREVWTQPWDREVDRCGTRKEAISWPDLKMVLLERKADTSSRVQVILESSHRAHGF